MKGKTNFKRLICAIICICMAMATVAAMVACDNQTPDESDATGATDPVVNETPRDGEIAVVRVIADMKTGEQITEDKVKIDYVLEENVHPNSIRELDKVIGKYVTTNVYVGEYLFSGKITDGKANVTESVGNDEYILVEDYVSAGMDAALTIQSLIYNNPGRALYFADGTYIIGKSIDIPANPEKAVSFVLSGNAVIKAADSWSATTAMLRMGSIDKGGAEDGKGISITGGVIDGSGKAMGISIEGGVRSRISDITLKNVTTGIDIKGDLGVEYPENITIDNIVITGTYDDTSVGMIVAADMAVIKGVRIEGMGTGIKAAGSDNAFINIHAKYSGSTNGAVGFDDTGARNEYNMCYSENYAIGFKMGAQTTANKYSTCYVFWSNDAIGTQTAFAAAGKFNSVIETSCVSYTSADAQTALLTVAESGGSGKLISPIVNGYANLDDKTSYTAYIWAPIVK